MGLKGPGPINKARARYKWQVNHQIHRAAICYVLFLVKYNISGSVCFKSNYMSYAIIIGEDNEKYTDILYNNVNMYKMLIL